MQLEPRGRAARERRCVDRCGILGLTSCYGIHPSPRYRGNRNARVRRRFHKYLLRTVAAGDGDRSLSTPPTRYYAEAGTPPGRWLGSGVTALGNGELTPGARVGDATSVAGGDGREPFTGDRRGAPIRVRGAPSALIMSTHRRWRRSPAGHSSRVCSTPLEHAEKIPGGIRQDHPSFLPGLPNVGM
ncbi:relaxase domain-containing protein [Arachnia propionica]|nr:relaxase domain-containing protein [Arachnia propionica]